jgi:hypothetical protein
LHTPDLLSGAGIDLNADFVKAWSSEDAAISKVGHELKIAGRSGQQSSIVATFKSVALPAGSLLVAFDVRAEPRPDYPDHLPRLIWVSADETSHLCVLPPKSMHFTYGMAGIPETPLNVLSLSIDNPEIIDTSFSTRCDAYWKKFKDEGEARWGYMITLPSWKLDNEPWVAWSKTVQLPSASCELVFYTYTGPNPWRSGLGAVRYEIFIGGEKVHSSENGAPKWMRKTVDLSGWAGQRITLRFVARPGATYKNGNPVWGPAWIAPKGHTPYIRPDDLAAHQLLTYANANALSASFYFRNLGRGKFNITLNAEGDEPVYISNFRAYNADDVMAGEYEHGAILANPSTAVFPFDLASLFPGSTFHRITGTANQDPTTNNGSAVGATVMVPPRDGLFLIKDGGDVGRR